MFINLWHKSSNSVHIQIHFPTRTVLLEPEVNWINYEIMDFKLRAALNLISDDFAIDQYEL